MLRRSALTQKKLPESVLEKSARSCCFIRPKLPRFLVFFKKKVGILCKCTALKRAPRCSSAVGWEGSTQRLHSAKFWVSGGREDEEDAPWLGRAELPRGLGSQMQTKEQREGCGASLVTPLTFRAGGARTLCSHSEEAAECSPGDFSPPELGSKSAPS